MTIQKAMLVVLVISGVLVSGSCEQLQSSRTKGVYPNYGSRQVWAVVPLINESGSASADGMVIADKLVTELSRQPKVDVVPVVRTLEAMRQLEMPVVTSLGDALALRQQLGVDGLVVGSITNYDPYDPPKLGLALELYVDPVTPMRTTDIRQLSRAATDGSAKLNPVGDNQPVTAVSGIFDAADPAVERDLQRWAKYQGVGSGDPHNWRLYRISMDLYATFVSHVVSSRLLEAEVKRLAATPTTTADP